MRFSPNFDFGICYSSYAKAMPDSIWIELIGSICWGANNCSAAPSDLSKIPMVLPPPGRDRSAETTEQQETDRLREFSSTIPFDRQETGIPVTAAVARMMAVTRQ